MRSELRQSFCCRCSNSASGQALRPEIPLPFDVSRIFSIGVIHQTWNSTQMSFERPAFQRLSSLRGKTCCRRSHFELFCQTWQNCLLYLQQQFPLGGIRDQTRFFLSDWKESEKPSGSLLRHQSVRNCRQRNSNYPRKRNTWELKKNRIVILRNEYFKTEKIGMLSSKTISLRTENIAFLSQSLIFSQPLIL